MLRFGFGFVSLEFGGWEKKSFFGGMGLETCTCNMTCDEGLKDPLMPRKWPKVR